MGKNGFKLFIKKKGILLIFVTALLFFGACEISLLYITVKWASVLLKFFSCVFQIIFSILGVSLLMEYTTLRKESLYSMEKMRDSIVNHTSQIDYIKNNYSETQKRQLLLMSYINDNTLKNNFIEDVDKVGMVSFDKIIEKLITSSYYEKDHMSVIYDCDGQHIFKKINRCVVVKNVYGANQDFTAKYSYDNILVGDSEVDSCILTSLRINDQVITEEDYKDYFTDGCCEGRETLYSKHKILKVPTKNKRETTIEYSMEIKLPMNDKMSLMTVTLPVKDYLRQVIMHKNDYLKDVDINVFSLSKAMKIEGESFICDIISDDVKIKNFKIGSSTWLFPGDGCCILFK